LAYNSIVDRGEAEPPDNDADDKSDENSRCGIESPVHGLANPDPRPRSVGVYRSGGIVSGTGKQLGNCKPVP
jgi:hypothetical protein